MNKHFGTGGLKEFLNKEMLKSKRSGDWFKLCKRERSFYSLALKLDIKLESPDLLRALTSVLHKLKQMSSRVYAELTKGTRLAWQFSQTAVTWGNSEARKWRNDQAYILFLGRFFGDVIRYS